MRFDPGSIATFRFLSHEFDDATATARLGYALDDRFELTEEIVFAGAELPVAGERRAALDDALRLLHLVAGVSYYKAAAPPEIVVEAGAPSAAMAGFLDRVYLHGLGEFAFRNGLDLGERIRFPAAAGGERAGAGEPAPSLELPRRTAVPVGGGKDSIVALEALRAAGEPIVLFSVGDPEPIRAIEAVAGLPRIVVERRLAPELHELNANGALNGHVPISAILAAILAAAAVLYGFDAAALANERSADAPNLFWKGRPVNHQWSKGLDFERQLGRVLAGGPLARFRYFSLLRPLSELSIAGLFSRHAAYRAVFRSCNAVFKLDPGRRAPSWCGRCPKCRFVFLVLAPFLERRELVEIFGADLFADPGQRAGFEALLGLAGDKPFECVGEVEESRAALALAAAAPDWRDSPVVEALAARALAEVADPRRLVREAMTPGSDHGVPPRYRPALAALAAECRADRERALAVLEAGAARAVGGRSGAGACD